MKAKFEELFSKAKGFWGGLDKKKKIAYLSVAGGALALVVILVVVAAASGSRVTLYKGLGATEANHVASNLRVSGIDAQIESDGNVTVPKADAAKAEMQLSLDGYTRAPYSYDIFKQGNSLLSSDGEKKAYLLFEIQNRLETAIRTIEGIDDAMVTIAVPDKSAFVLEGEREEASASVKLTIGGLVPKLSSKQVRGIKTQVARGVPGLEPDRVAVLDNEGNLLEDDEDKSSEKETDFLKMKDKVDSSIREKVLSLLVPMFGKDNVKVAANSVLNYDSREVKETSYTPTVGEDKGIIQHREESAANEENGKTRKNEELGLVQGNAEVSNYPEKSNEEETSSSSRRDVVEDYLVNKKEEQVVKNAPTVETLSVAVAINQEEMPQQQKNELTRLIASAAGIAENRVELCNMRFTVVTGLDSSMTVGEFFKTPLGVVVLALSAIVVLLLLVLVGLALRGKRRANTKPQEGAEPPMNLEEFIKSSQPNLPQGEPASGLGITSEIPSGLAQEFEAPSLEELAKPEGTEEEDILKNVLTFVDENSEIASQFIKSWMRSGDATEND